MCGKTNWQLPTLAQLEGLYNEPLNTDYFQYWSIGNGGNSNTHTEKYLSSDVRSSSSNYCLELDGDSAYCSRTNWRGEYHYLYMMLSEPTKPVPVAPTNGVVVDTADINSFGWDNVSGFTNPSNYQYTIDGAVKWLDVSANPQPLNDRNITAGDVQVRIKAQPLQYLPAGNALLSLSDFTSLSTCIGYQSGGLCYELSTVEKSHSDATTHCQAEGSELISKNSTVTFNDMASFLTLDTNVKYWLKERYSYPSYAYSLRYSSSWSPDGAYKHVNTEQYFICVK
ncbi:MAG: hypothetical protein JKY14_13625 [Paraglaciecola sp.]|nr:hypothetical protein [Paraglaciecola sp.]